MTRDEIIYRDHLNGVKVKDLAMQYGLSKDSIKKICRKQRGRVYDRSDLIQSIARTIEKNSPGWEYVGGFTHSDGYVVVRHECGFTTRLSCNTLRHVRDTKCWLCEQRKAKQRQAEKEKKKATAREVRQFYKPVPKYSQQELKSCSVCGALFYGSLKKKTCSDKCSKRIKAHYDNMKKRRRRKDSWTSDSSTITLEKLFARDEGICWICGGRCDKDADSNDNMYPSVDHVIPISHGGKDSWDNVKLAHRLCNTLKGAKVLEVHPPVVVL